MFNEPEFIKHALVRFRQDRKGSVIIIFAFSVAMLLLLGGGAVDLYRQFNVKTKLLTSLDASVLAAGSVGNFTDAERIDLGNKMFAATTANMKIGAVGVPSITIGAGGRITGTVSSNLPSTFLNIIGISNLNVSVKSVALLPRPKKGEIALVLDYSGSMNRNGKYQAMRDSAINLIQTLMALGTMDLKIGLVPFSEYVYTDMNTEYIKDVHPDKYGLVVRACLDSRRYPSATKDTTPVLANQDTKWPAPGMPDEYQLAGALDPALDPNATIDPVANCPVSMGGMMPEPEEGIEPKDECTRNYTTPEQDQQATEGLVSDFADVYPQCAQYRDKGVIVRPLTTDMNALVTQLNLMTPIKLTNIALALEYGWHMLSPNDPYTEGVNYGTPDMTKTIVLLTDGRQTVGGFGPAGSFSVAQGDSNTAELCTGIKAKGITLITIAFDLAGDVNAKTLLSNCASAPKYALVADTNTELATVFQDLAIKFQDQLALVE